MFRIEERDIKFNLFEYMNVVEALSRPKYQGMDRATLEMLMDNAFKIAKEVIAPVNVPGDKEGCTFKDGKVTTPKSYKKAYDAYCGDGWIGISAPQEFGGTGAPVMLGLAVNECVVTASSAFAMYPGLTRSAVALLLDHASAEQKAVFVEKMLAGTWGGTMCITEAGAGSAVGDAKTTAVKNPRGLLQDIRAKDLHLVRRT